MSGFTPSALLLWSILACLFEAFLVVHLWSYDRFQCIKWSSGRQPGAFKRVMTYSYLATVPTLMVFAVGMTVLSYREGWIVIPHAHGTVSPSIASDMITVLPKPFAAYSHQNKRWLLPLYFLLSAAWAMELVTHLEELTFWLFLLHQGPSKRDWFHSWEFRTWSFGSIAAVLGMPICVLVRRKDYDACLAWILFSGSSAGTLTTICFIYVLVRFPGFMRRVKAEGAEPDVVVRLATFYQLNVIRIVFRFLFNFSLLTLALDGIRGPHGIARTLIGPDLLAMLGGIGCFVSSAITLLIFFPRSITRESGYRAKISSTPSAQADPDGATSPLPDYNRHHRNPSSPKSPGESQPGQTPRRMRSFRFPAESEYSLPSVQQHHRPTRTTSYTSHRRASSEGDATPDYYESDPEFPAVSRRRRLRGGEDGGSDVMIWEMQRPAEIVRAYRQRHTHQRSAEGVAEDEPPSWNDDYYNEDPYKPKGRNNSSPMVVLSSDDPPITLEEGQNYTTPRSSFVHPYVMTFTSPIDLLDVDNGPRAI